MVRRLFNRHGFESVSIVQVMANAGLTHGGFYSYFKSKSELYSEVLGCFFTDPDWKNCWEGVHVDLRSTDVGPQVVRAYLSRPHLEDRASSATTARSIAALCVGGMIIARTMVDRRLADELRLACIATAMQLGGWNRKRLSASAPMRRVRSR